MKTSAAIGGQTSAPAQGGVAQAQIAEIQRSRLLAAAAGAIDELGYANTTVADITARARVSRRTFYELFANREECLVAVLENVVDMITRQLASIDLTGMAWRERVRLGTWTILSLFEHEPALARVCVVGGLGGSAAVLERRAQILARLTAVVDEGRLAGARGANCTPLTAEGLVGGALAIVHARLLNGGAADAGEPARLTPLLGELMGMIVLPYLGPAAARRETARRTPPPIAVSTGAAADADTAAHATDDPLDGVTMRLTYRTAKVLEAVDETPGVNNRQVAQRAGIQDQGQVSKLLARLERLGLLVNGSDGRAHGEPNAWSLSAKGRRVARGIHAHARQRHSAHGRRVAA